MKKKSTYYTWSHNIEGCLRNGSYVVKREYEDGTSHFGQYMNGDYMNRLPAVPDGMVEVDAKLAKKLLPKCCG